MFCRGNLGMVRCDGLDPPLLPRFPLFARCGRLQLVKRQMHGRAKFNPLRPRALPFVTGAVTLSPQGRLSCICQRRIGLPWMRFAARECIRREKSTARTCSWRWAAAWLTQRFAKCWVWAAQRCGGPAPHTVKAAWNTRCTMKPGRGSHVNTRPTRRRRWSLWLVVVARLRAGANAGRSACFDCRRSGALRTGPHQSGDGAPDVKNNDRKPWRRLMRCIGRITAEYRDKMYTRCWGCMLDRTMRKSRCCASMRRVNSCSGRPVRRSPGNRASAPMTITNTDGPELEISLWRNAAGRGIEWKFTRQDADRKLCRHYVS